MKLLLTAIGKRVELITHLKETFEVIGCDCNDLAPSKYFVDKFYKVLPANNKNYVQELLDICTREKVKILIPLYEKEFDILIQYKEDFLKIGTTILLSDKNIIDIFNDKINTYESFVKNNIKTPKTYIKSNWNEVHRFPVIVKPLDGMGSSMVFKAKNKKELEFFKDYVPNAIIQEFIEGTEYTIDILCDLDGNVISIVPRVRLEVRGGEVTKSKTVMHLDIISKSKEIANNYKFRGPITLQCIENINGEIFFIELNPRFGGGVPLSFYSGINYGKLIESMILGEKVQSLIGDFKEKVMLRYDEAIVL